jgi:alpha-tubulin suppressor-like RCC1 family protein
MLDHLKIFSKVKQELLQTIKVVSIFEHGYQDQSLIFVTHQNEVYTLGNNSYYQLGVGDNLPRDTPTKLSSLCGLPINFVKMTQFNCSVITDDGDLYMWGNNRDGQCGTGAKGVPQKVPAKIQSFYEKVIDVQTGPYHSIAITKSGCVFTWGQ